MFSSTGYKTLVSIGVIQGRWYVSGHPAHPDFHGMVSSQKVRLLPPPAQQQTTDNRRAQIQVARVGTVESAKDITPVVTGTYCILGAQGRMWVQTRVFHVTGRLTFWGAFKIP